jgi:uncharacterized membrane protein (DUF373 family)
MKEKILLGYRYFEHFIVLILLGLLMAVVLYATIGLVVFIALTMAEKLHTREVTITLPLLHDVFAGFLMLLIGLELMKTIVMYLEEHVIHVEVVLSVAMIAIARHAIDVDYKVVPPLAMIGMGSIIIALAVGYFFFRKASLITQPGGNITPGYEGKDGAGGKRSGPEQRLRDTESPARTGAEA